MLTAFLFVLCTTAVGVAVYFVMDGPRRKHLSALAKLEARADRLDDDEEDLQAERRELTALAKQQDSAIVAGRRELAAREAKLSGEITGWFEAAAGHWNADPTPFAWGGKRAARRARARARRHAVGGSGAETRRPVRRRRKGYGQGRDK